MHWLPLTQLGWIACYIPLLYSVSPFCNITAALHHSRFVWEMPAFPASCLSCTAALEKVPVSGFMSQHLASSNPSLSLLIAPPQPHPSAALAETPPGASLYQFPAGLQEPCKRQSGMMWFLSEHLFVMLFSPACFNLQHSVFPGAWWGLNLSSYPLKCASLSITLNLKAGEQGVCVGEQSLPARWHCCPTKKLKRRGRQTRECDCRKGSVRCWDFDGWILTNNNNNNQKTINCWDCH